MFNQTPRSLKGLFILSGLISASTAWADETTNAPGSACVATGSATLTVPPMVRPKTRRLPGSRPSARSSAPWALGP